MNSNIILAGLAISAALLTQTASAADSLTEILSLTPCGKRLQYIQDRANDCGQKNLKTSIVENSKRWDLVYVNESGEGVWHDLVSNNYRASMPRLQKSLDPISKDFNFKSSPEVQHYIDLISEAEAPQSKTGPIRINVTRDGLKSFDSIDFMRNTKRTQRQDTETLSPQLFMRNTQRTQRQGIESKNADVATESQFNP